MEDPLTTTGIAELQTDRGNDTSRDCAYYEKFHAVRAFGDRYGLIDIDENQPVQCCGSDRVPRGAAPAKRELIKLWYGRTLMPMRHMFAWAVPSRSALGLIEKTVRANCLAGVVEIGAGKGYWAMLLGHRGVDVVAFDKDINGGMRCNTGCFFNHPVPFADIYCGGPLVLRNQSYISRALFLCYPPPGDLMCVEALNNYKGNYLIYAGALDSGHPLSASLRECWRVPHPCGVQTGHPKFFEVLASEWHVVEHVPLPSHFFCRDSLVVLERCSPARVDARSRPEPHLRQTPKWSALSPEEAGRHVFEVERKNWAVVEEQFLQYAQEHGLSVECDGEGQMVRPLVPRVDHPIPAGGQAREGCGQQQQLDIGQEPVDPSLPWKEALRTLMQKFPSLTSEAFHARLVLVHPDLTMKTVKNARKKLLKS